MFVTSVAIYKTFVVKIYMTLTLTFIMNQGKM